MAHIPASSLKTALFHKEKQAFPLISNLYQTRSGSRIYAPSCLLSEIPFSLSLLPMSVWPLPSLFYAHPTVSRSKPVLECCAVRQGKSANHPKPPSVRALHE